MTGQGGLLSASANANMLSALQVSSSALQSNNKCQMRKSATIQNHQQTTAAATTTTVAANSSSGATATAAVEYSPQEVNVLLDPEIINDYPTQALVLTVLATLVRNTTDENEIRVLYQYIAEASIVFPKGRLPF